MERVLVIEKDKSLSLRIESIFENAGFSVVSCISYDDALTKINQGQYFASILDMDLEEQSWEKSIILMKDYDIPVIVFSSGLYTPQLRTTLLERGVLDFIWKDNKRNVELLLEGIERLRLNSMKKVLIVDDSPSARAFAQSILEQNKFQVLTAGDGMEALGLIENQRDIKIVITDFEMPHMNGYELARIIRSLYKKNSLSIIGISHPSTEASSASFLKNGANDFIRKPFSVEEFYCRVITQAELLEAFERESELNDQKNKLISMISHDIRVPLATIQSICQKFLDKLSGKLPEQVQKGLNAILQTSSQMLHLLEDLLNISSLEKGVNTLSLSDVSLVELTQERLDLFFADEAARKNLSLTLEKNSLKAVPMDKDRISQVIDNLLSNAIKFTPAGGEIIINIKEKKGRQVFRIWDTGPGLNQYDMEHVFQEFQRLSAKPTGGESSTGLGLAICHKIVLLHKGQIWVNSKPGIGAEFCFSLPSGKEPG